MVTLGRGDVGQLLDELALVHCAQQRSGLAGRVDEHESGLTGDLEVCEHVTAIVVHLRERQPMTVDEPLEGIGVTEPGDTVEVDLAVPLLS